MKIWRILLEILQANFFKKIWKELKENSKNNLQKFLFKTIT